MFIEITPQHIQRGLIGFAILVGIGVLVHDTRIDQATALALTLPAGLALAAIPSLHSEGHTHAERGAYGQMMVMGMPRIQPRNDHKKYLIVRRTATDTDYTSGVIWPSV